MELPQAEKRRTFGFLFWVGLHFYICWIKLHLLKFFRSAIEKINLKKNGQFGIYCYIPYIFWCYLIIWSKFRYSNVQYFVIIFVKNLTMRKCVLFMIIFLPNLSPNLFFCFPFCWSFFLFFLAKLSFSRSAGNAIQQIKCGLERAQEVKRQPCLTIIVRPCVKLPEIRNEEVITAPLYFYH